MNCESCGQRPALVHWRDPEDPRGEPTWLCPVCAGERAGDDPSGSEDPADAAPVAAFLAADLAESGPETCPDCGWTASRFRRTNRLGCARCYVVFRRRLAPILGRYHRHVSHLGKVPPRRHEEPSLLAEITRSRVALEKAVASEDFEAAAALRDSIRQLEIEANDPESQS